MTPAPTPAAPAPDLVVLSDLHLSEGRRGDPPRYSLTEDFFHDDAFARLLGHLRAQYRDDPSQVVLVLNGDVFDFLTVVRVPDRHERHRRNWTVWHSEERFGLNPTPDKSVFKLNCILTGHPVFFQALAEWLAAGHRVELLRGNHDLELAFDEVQQRLRDHLCGLPGGPSPAQIDSLRIHQWFLLEPGRVYIEHGNQYEASNSIRYPLRPLLPEGRLSRREHAPMLDYPLGSLFVRYFYNGVHHLDPYTPKVPSFEQYLEFLRRYNLIDLWRIARNHYPFFLRALRPQTPGGSSGPTAEAEQEQRRAFDQHREETEPKDLHRSLAELKIHPLSASKSALVREMMRPVLRRTAWVAGAAFGSLYLWLLIFNLIQATSFLAENVFAKAILLAVFSVATLASLLWAGNYLGRRLRRRDDEVVERCVERADRIARLTGAPLVLMGHTHMVDMRRVAGGAATYANSGTWTSIENPWKRLVPGARRFSFLLVRGSNVRLCRWDDAAGRIADEPLFDKDSVSL